MSLLHLKLIDKIIPEPAKGAHEDPEEAATLLGKALQEGLAEFKGVTPQQLAAQRYEKFRHMGDFFTERAGMGA